MKRAFLSAVFLSAISALATAGTELPPDKTVVVESTPFDQGKWELQSSTGAYFSVNTGGRPTLNYWSTSYRLGLMLSTPSGDGCLRGNSEVLIEGLYGTVFDGAGNWLGGVGLLYRYNFVQPDSRWVPYFQLGGGVVWNDIYKDHSQRLIGQSWEFELEAQLGIRYMFSDRWSIALEGGFRHISNADLNDRNVGVNSFGASIGLGRHW